MNILGPATATRYRLYTNLITRGTGSVTSVFGDMLDPLWDAAVEHGIDPAVMIAQSAHETGFGTFGRAVNADHHNTCGLKIRDPKPYPDDAAAAHAQFASWETGARAHAQHLIAYTTATLPPGEELVDPRWIWVAGRHNLTNVEELGGRWAPAPDYGLRVAALAARLTA